VPWHVAQVANEVCSECRPVAGGMAWQVVQDGGGGGGVQACERTGVPAQPLGEEETTVRVCVPLVEQALHSEYVYVQTGGVYVQACVTTGDPPVQPAGDDVSTVRVCVLFDWHAPHAE